MAAEPEPDSHDFAATTGATGATGATRTADDGSAGRDDSTRVMAADDTATSTEANADADADAESRQDPNHPGYRTVADEIMGRDPVEPAGTGSTDSADHAYAPDGEDAAHRTDSTDDSNDTAGVDGTDSTHRADGTDRAARE